MSFDTAAVLAEIDSMLARYQEVEKEYSQSSQDGFGRPISLIIAPHVVYAEIIAQLHDTLRRLAPSYGYADKVLNELPNKSYGWQSTAIRTLAGVLKSLRADYAAGRTQAFQERLRSDLFSDFLEMAEYLLDDEKLKDPAAVLAGGVLEQHLRKLCAKHSVPMAAQPKLDLLNADLAKKGAYGKNEQKQITAWAGIRNDAAHADYGKYDAKGVKLMIQGIRHFLTNYPA